MKVILLERVERLGGLGDIVDVKDGFARNFLLPRSKALRANSANIRVFEAQRTEIESRNAKARAEAAIAALGKMRCREQFEAIKRAHNATSPMQ